MSPSTMPAISAPNSRAMSSERTSESSTTSCSSAAAMVARIQQLLRQDQGDGDAVGDEVLPRHPLLPPVGGRAEAEGAIDEIDVQPVGVPLQHDHEVGGELGEDRGHGVAAFCSIAKGSAGRRAPSEPDPPRRGAG